MDESINKEADLINKMNAFFYYKSEGIKSVERIFPEQLEFVLANKERSYDEVKSELLAQMPDSAK